MDKTIIIIDGNNFVDTQSFHKEMDKVLTKNIDFETGHNFNAFNDLLKGGFGVFEYEEPIIVIWENSQKSKALLGNELTDHIIEMISGHEHIEFSIKS